ncbi:MAG: TetR/AcrR family transcriptional regulator [Candidatus Eremiobacteraeota bacterium]|nr:TetR/AcrR family transcriptional regulator [Candidatus Eremiobacteraeota bacterium]
MIAREINRPSVEDTRERILCAAREIFVLKGPHGTTTREIADRAGVNEATLFRHFGSKFALLDAMKEYHCQNTEARMALLFENLSGDLEADLRAIATSMIEGMSRNQDLIRVSVFEQAADPNGEHAPMRAPNVIRVHLASFLAKQISEGRLAGDPEILARVFMGMFFAYVIGRGFWSHDVLDEDAAVEMFVHIFLNGARSR